MTEGPRRSGRIRTAVASYADARFETGFRNDPAMVEPAQQRVKLEDKSLIKHESSDDDDQIPHVVFTKRGRGFEAEAAEDYSSGNTIVAKKPAKRGRKAVSEIKPEHGQLYGHPTQGTMIPWLNNRMRKMPKIYEVRRKSYGDKNTNPPKVNTDTTWFHAEAAEKRIARATTAIKRLAPGQLEVRAKTYVGEPPEWYDRFLHNASTQKICVLERSRGIEENCHANHDDCPYEVLQVAGSKGNVYTVTISHLLSCTCPVTVFNKKGAEKLCKHILYVLHYVLKVSGHLRHQSALLSSELKDIFRNAPLLVDTVEDTVMDGRRKRIEGDCPICFTEFEDNEDTVWCRAACGNNLHKQCFSQWAKAKHRHVTCPFCRSDWQAEDPPAAQKMTVAKVQMPTERGVGGYRNVLDQLEHD